MGEDVIECMFGCRYGDDKLGTSYKNGQVDDVYSRHWEKDCLGNPDSNLNKFAVRKNNVMNAEYTGHFREQNELTLKLSEYDFRRFIRAGYPSKVKIVFDDVNAPEPKKMVFTETKPDDNGTGISEHNTSITYHLEKT